MDIYSRVAELAAKKESKISDKEFFTSKEYQTYTLTKTRNIISGSCHELRRMGFKVSSAEENKLLYHLNAIVEFNSKSQAVAYAAKSAKDTLLYINAGCDLVQALPTREERHLAVLGLLYHEVGHLLFTDFPTLRAWMNQIEKGLWFPQPPKAIRTVNGINLASQMTDKNFLEILSECGHSIQNSIEDGYIEREMRAFYPGKAVGCLATINDSLLSHCIPLDKAIKDPKASEFDLLMNQILIYSKFGDLDLGEYDGDLLDPIYEAVDVIDDCSMERDPSLRFMAANELLCILYPYLKKDIDKKEKEQKNAQGQNQQGQNQGQGSGGNQQGQGSDGGTSDANGSSGNGQGNPSNDTTGNSSGSDPVSDAVADAMTKAIKQIAKNAGTSSEKKEGDTSALNNPSKTKNAGAEKKQSNSKGSSNGANSGNEGGSGAGSNSGEATKNSAKRDINNLTSDIAENAAKRQAEKERTEELNSESKNIDLGEFGLNESISVSVTRAEEVSQQNIDSYERVADDVLAISRDLQRDIKHVLKERRAGGKLRNLPFGRRFEVSSVVHDDNKYFSRNKLPTESPKLGVGLLVDESGSTGGELIRAATKAAIVIEDFCRELKIPHIINGYTSSYGSGAHIFSYAEPKEIDDGNRYRITGMDSRGGTPTKAALGYMFKRMLKLNVDVHLLIVISDGQSGDNYENSTTGERPITTLIREAKRRNIIVVAAGIGANRKQVEKEFGDNFLDISDLNEMPRQLTELIKANLWV